MPRGSKNQNGASKKARAQQGQPKKKKAASRRGAAPAADREFARGNCSLICPDGGEMLRLPDGVGSRSMTMQSITTTVITTNATGYSWDVFQPSSVAELHYPSATESAGAVLTWDTARTASSYASLEANASEMRVVSATIKVDYIGNNLSNGGSIAVKAYSPSSAVTAGTAPADVPKSHGDYATRTFYGRAADGVSIIAMVNDEMALRSFHTPSSVTALNLRGLKCYGVFITGADVTSPQSWLVTITQNIEFVPDARNWMGQLASASPARDTAYLERVSKVFRSVAEAGYDVVTSKEATVVVAKIARSLLATRALRGPAIAA